MNTYQDEASQSESLRLSFAEMRKAGWNVDTDLLWGYFFVDANLQKLNSLKRHLEQLGFRFVDVFEIEDEDEPPSGEHMLHVERIEAHSPITLAKRNVAFSVLASEYGVRAYDGWDVGLVE